jgi:hypothetical protein
MASETESNASPTLTSPHDLANDVADISLASEDAQSQLKLPEHDQHSIRHSDRTFKRGKARPAKQRERSPNTWYWKYREEIYESKQRRWLYEYCWKDKKFIHYSQTSNRAIIKHLKDAHHITEYSPTSII